MGMLTWKEAFDAGPARCGGKGYNLARLHRYGFGIPDGGVLPAGEPLSALHNLEHLHLFGATIAVRSSATGEDSERASFAGIHQSFLNVTGTADIERAAQGCLDSLNTPTAIAYRRQMGFADDEVRCAVVLCRMVEARCAGVAFSCDPATGRRDLITIDAVPGLAEDLVSGRVNPVRSSWRNQSGKLVHADGFLNGLLPAAVESELVDTVLRVHWALGEGQNPQDIEWAWDGTHLWLLQARPVTRLPRVTWPVIAHLPRYWSTANIKDAVPGVVCELTWSALCDGVGEIAYAAPRAAGYELPPGMEVARRFDGRGFFDLTLMQWAFYDAVGIAPADVVKVVGGHQPVIEIPAAANAKPDQRRRKKAVLRLARTLWNYPARIKPLIERQLHLCRRLAAINFSELTHSDLLRTLEEIRARQGEFLPVAGLANSCGGPWQTALDQLVRDPALVSRLQAGSGLVVSAEQGYRLYDVARGRATLEEFLHDFGHRGVYEADLLNPRWAEDPSWLLQQIDAIRANPTAPDPRAAAQSVRLAAESEVRRRFPLRSPLILWLARKLRSANGARESAKSALVCLALPLRLLVLELGRRLVANNLLDLPESALHLSFIDLKCLLTGSWDGSGVLALTQDRRERRARWLAIPPIDLIEERGDGRISAPTPTTAPSPASSTGWSGLAVSPGQASGIARILHTPADASRLHPGEILVAPSTDPGWTPLFLRAAAIVTETGGYLSHGAIVAREFGLPAVANLPGILAELRDGESIYVDGNTGAIRRTSA